MATSYELKSDMKRFVEDLKKRGDVAVIAWFDDRASAKRSAARMRRTEKWSEQPVTIWGGAAPWNVNGYRGAVLARYGKRLTEPAWLDPDAMSDDERAELIARLMSGDTEPIPLASGVVSIGRKDPR